MKSFIVLMLLGLCVPTPARADEDRVIPAGSTITLAIPGKPKETVTAVESLFLMTRQTLEQAYSKVAVCDDFKQNLLTCQNDVALLSKKDEGSTFITAIKWTGIGAAVVGAFVIGLMIGH